MTYPSIGPVAVSIEPNPFWSFNATGITSVSFHVDLKTASWLAWTLVPVALLWALTFLVERLSSRRAA
nr:putative integron gene cassette protein [uncultured bacterium]